MRYVWTAVVLAQVFAPTTLAGGRSGAMQVRLRLGASCTVDSQALMSGRAAAAAGQDSRVVACSLRAPHVVTVRWQDAPVRGATGARVTTLEF